MIGSLRHSFGRSQPNSHEEYSFKGCLFFSLNKGKQSNLRFILKEEEEEEEEAEGRWQIWQ